MEKITGPKVITLSGTQAPWVYEIERRLRAKGFKIKRMNSQLVATEKVSETRTESYKEASARYILDVNGYAPSGSMRQCFGGGYDFQYLNVELLDVKTNEIAMHYSDSGYSENCQPMSGSIFGDVAESVSSLWK